MSWIRERLKIIVPVGVVLTAGVAYLAFGVFGVQTLFIDDTVDDAGPVFDSGAAASSLTAADDAATGAADDGATSASDDAAEPDAASDGDAEPAVGTDRNKVDKLGAGGEVQASLDAVADDDAAEPAAESAAETPVAEPPAEEVATDEPAAEEVAAPAEPQIVTLVEGTFIPRGRYSGEGRALVLNDGSEQRFLRFEEFATDNGPDLKVYLVNSDAMADEGTFDDDFVNLGELRGNIGDQNYEIPTDVDLGVYDTVVVWCERFSSAFTAADLTPVG